MNSTIMELQYRVACLETQLTVERQRNSLSEKTVLYLSTLLAQQARIDVSRLTAASSDLVKTLQDQQRRVKGEINSVRASATSQDIAGYATVGLSRSHRGLGEYHPNDLSGAELDNQDAKNKVKLFNGILSQPLNLIDFDHISTDQPVTDLHVAASVNNVDILIRQVESISNSVSDTKVSDTSVNTITTKSLSDDDNISGPIEDINDKPPKLDLNFKGLRTSHDGPEVSDKRATSNFNQSTRPVSFEEAFGLHDVRDGCRTTHSSKVDLNADNVLATGNKPVRTTEAFLKNVSDSIINFSRSNSYKSRIPTQRSQTSNSTRNSEIFRQPLFTFHGIHYKPREDDLFLNRSRVMVFNLPLNTTIADVLSKTRGGIIISCQLLNTEFAYNSLSAMIRFSSYVEAMRCVDHAMTNPIILNGKTISFQLILTPSYPLDPEIYKNIFEHGHTRCLRVYVFRQVPTSIQTEYTNPKYIEYQATNGCGDWFVRFTSVQPC